ncbi:sugar phosphate isomerase/epimerase [Rheinheimera soli]|uniref:Sugar phosphate isomerase/epimerase n=1 Tax=Rheinheimera soli TaxID=443616 RepID=A0ABU1W2E0_9GAMM|nr:sugar phosphate isomerase/epimerase [Rheinheimera soli]MDR7121908.1 sugar phosphate isomerase/epimerase [Rheinheimera soli]
MLFLKKKLTTTVQIISLILASTAAGFSYADTAPVTATEPQLSVQLWSVKDAMQADFEGTLTKLAAMGFQGVEFAGFFGKYANDAAGLKAFLNSLGLKASGAHVPFEKFSTEQFDATVAFYKALDCHYLIIPMDQRAFTVEGAKAVAADLAAVQEKLTPLGMQVGYHNHKPEMLGDAGKTPWDLIGKNTNSKVILQQDVGWTEVAGKDPVDFIKAYPGRTVTTHYKASAPEPGNTEDPIIGKDTTDWKALITANKTIGGTQWLVVEQESYPAGMTPMQSVEASLKGLQAIIAEMK